MKQIKTIFKMDELKDALDEIFKAKYVRGWSGHLELETDGKDIVLCQFPSSSSWIEGHQTFFELESYRTFSDEISGLELQEDGRWKNDAGEIQTAEEILSYVDIENIVDIDSVQERLDEIVQDMEAVQ